MWKVYQEAGRPWPVLCEDEVIDYQIMEAIFIKSRKEDHEMEKKAERDNWKKDGGGLDHLRNLAG